MLLTLACLAVGGVLAGGAWSLRAQRASVGAVVVVAALAALALAAGVLRVLGAMTA